MDSRNARIYIKTILHYYDETALVVKIKSETTKKLWTKAISSEIGVVVNVTDSHLCECG